MSEEKIILIILILVFVVVGLFFIVHNYPQLLGGVANPSTTPVGTNLYEGTDVQIKNIYKIP